MLKIYKLDDLLRTLKCLNIKHRRSISGDRNQFITIMYYSKGMLYSADFYKGGVLIGLWGNKKETRFLESVA